MPHNSLFNGLAEQLDAGLSNDSGFTEPFRVHYFKPFTDDLYQAILDHLPDDRFYGYLMHRELVQSDGTSSRLGLPLTDERIEALPGPQKIFWRELTHALKGPEVRDVFRKHLAPQLMARFNAPVDQIPFHSAPLLFRDLAGYKLSPHPDSPRKVCTIQAYLPSDDSNIQLGTSVYRQLEDGSLELSRTLEYRPNTAYCFTVTNNSWHGNPFWDFSKPRNSLMLTYYRTPAGPFNLKYASGNAASPQQTMGAPQREQVEITKVEATNDQ